MLPQARTASCLDLNTIPMAQGGEELAGSPWGPLGVEGEAASVGQ